MKFSWQQYFVPDNQFCILLPGKEVPNWVNHQVDGSSITIEMSPDWYYSNFLGFAVCFVFTEKPATHCEISCQLNNFSFFYYYPDPQTAFMSYHMWLAYQPRCRIDICHPDEWTQIKASFEINGVGDLIHKCGICPIYAHDHKKDGDDTTERLVQPEWTGDSIQEKSLEEQQYGVVSK